ncbi:hypothetical protein M8C21_014231 [Ambrosia artemisiifolia]|uniref:Uncharacterized protein n=1 Tax=Ambrosia artemisiifolia TaxID=4212 RepID=A0AAD5BKQ2_AMBAR|nr:hypothetical protein M8C21_014231 [Ambrosia artemisiifolia]
MEPQLGRSFFMEESKNKYLPTNDLHQPSGYDEFLSAHRSLFANGLKDLRNVKEQLYSAAEHFQDSYHKNDQKQMLLESLKDYISKSLLKTVDHLGCVTNKSIIATEGCISGANKDKKELVMSSGLRKGYSGRTSTELPLDLITFSLTKAASHKKLEKRSRSRSMSPLRFSIKCSGSSAIQPTCPSFSVKLSASSVYRSISPNPSSSRQQQPPEAMKSQTLYPQRPITRDMEIYSKKTRKLFKALLRIYKSKNNII